MVSSTPGPPPIQTTNIDDMRGNDQTFYMFNMIFNGNNIILIAGEVEVARMKVIQLQKKYIHITSCAAEYMSTNITVRTLQYSLLCLPPALKEDHKTFIQTATADIEKAESVDKVFYVVGGGRDFLNYSLLKYLIDLYGSDEMKEEMAKYVTQIIAFRRETRLQVFSEACQDEDDGKFSLLVTKHDMDWATATLEDVENFRLDVCRELSLYSFSLRLLVVAQGCVEVTWQVPHSLVTYIQALIKPSSPSMMKHHVSTLTIDGFIAYHSTTGIFITL